MSAIVYLDGNKPSSSKSPFDYTIMYADPKAKRNSIMPKRQSIKPAEAFPRSPRDVMMQKNFDQQAKPQSIKPPEYESGRKSLVENGPISSSSKKINTPVFYPSPVPQEVYNPHVKNSFSVQPRNSIAPQQKYNQVGPRKSMFQNPFQLQNSYPSGQMFNNRVNDNKMATPKQLRKISGFFMQLRILAWKNLILTWRNMCGLIAEMGATLGVIALLIIIRSFVGVYYYSAQTNSLSNVFDLYSPTAYSTPTPLLLYYPNNTFIKGIVTNAVSIIQKRVPIFNPTSLYP